MTSSGDFLRNNDVMSGWDKEVPYFPEASFAQNAAPAGGGKIRILIQAINFAPEIIGCGAFTSDLVRHLARAGHMVEVVTAPPHYPGWYVRKPYHALAYVRETVDGVRITRCPILMKTGANGIWRLIAPLTFSISAAPALFWRILKFRPDVVLCVEPTLFAAPATVLAAKITGARTLLQVQDLEVDAAFEVGHIKLKQFRGFAHFCERILLRAFDKIVTISEKMRVALVAKGFDERRVSVIRNWVDLSRIAPHERGASNNFRFDLGFRAEDFVVLYAGHLGVKQALDCVIDAARRLKGDKRIRFVIAGAGPALGRLKALAADLPNVSFLPLQPVERLSELLAAADVHVLPQHQGAADLVLPSKLGGMLASGRLISATAEAHTEIAELLTGIALLSPPGDGAALARSISDASQMSAADYKERTDRGTALAQTLSAERLLVDFEQLLIGVSAKPREAA